MRLNKKSYKSSFHRCSLDCLNKSFLFTHVGATIVPGVNWKSPTVFGRGILLSHISNMDIKWQCWRFSLRVCRCWNLLDLFTLKPPEIPEPVVKLIKTFCSRIGTRSSDLHEICTRSSNKNLLIGSWHVHGASLKYHQRADQSEWRGFLELQALKRQQQKSSGILDRGIQVRRKTRISLSCKSC